MNAGNVVNKVIGQMSAEVAEVTEMEGVTEMEVAATDATADLHSVAADRLISDVVKAAVALVKGMMADLTK